MRCVEMVGPDGAERLVREIAADGAAQPLRRERGAVGDLARCALAAVRPNRRGMAWFGDWLAASDPILLLGEDGEIVRGTDAFVLAWRREDCDDVDVIGNLQPVDAPLRLVRLYLHDLAGVVGWRETGDIESPSSPNEVQAHTERELRAAAHRLLTNVAAVPREG